MKILINCSTLKAGGGLQVANSICDQLPRFSNHQFTVVLSSYLQPTFENICNKKNIEACIYDFPTTLFSVLFGRDKMLDELVEQHQIDVVLTIFGPSRWKPRVPHLSGFAIPHLLIPESPYFKKISVIDRLKWKCRGSIIKWSLRRSSDAFWTENPLTSERLQKMMAPKYVYTVSNYYNQVFDQPKRWNRGYNLPMFNGTTCLSIAAPYPHKNLNIIADIVKYFKVACPDFKVRFVLSCNSEDCNIPEYLNDYIIYLGKIDVSACPYLYEQADIMFMPTLLECFSATYPEAMRMGIPIVTTDIVFARGLCGDAACYFSPNDPVAAAKAIYKVATDKNYAKLLCESGKEKLQTYDNYEQRAEKLIGILEKIADYSKI